MTERQLSNLLHSETPEPPASIDLPAMAARIQSDTVVRRSRRRWLMPMTAAAAVIGVVAAAVLVAQLTGDDGSPAPVSAGTPSVAGSGPRPTDQQLAWARKLVERWDTQAAGSTFIPIGMTGQWDFQEVRNWPPGAMRPGGPYALAFDARKFVSRVELPTQPPAAGRIAWADGRTLPTDVLAAKATFDRMLTSSVRCSTCPYSGSSDGAKVKPLTVTDATLATMQIQTTRGQATVPAWRFSFAETTDQALEAAVKAPATVAPAALNATIAPPMVAIDRVEVAPDGRTLIARFVGFGGTSAQACGAEYSGYAVQSDHTVGIVVTRVASPNGPTTCTEPGHLRTVTVRLDGPLKDRAVIETARGTAVSMRRG